ncbi:MAG: DNA repair exonuclease [Magnetococcales bacterium]|nr:DNA repair exonuclease [Magnetococcales bacterium]MBF0157223.1 DNA repair exonuclease [Magnetococcales bacterium]
MRFIHAADIHLDSPLKGLSLHEGAPENEIRGAVRRAFTNLIAACCQERVDFLLLAGDLYDGHWQDFNTGLFFVRQMAILREAGIRAFFVRGNHDAENRHLTPDLPLPDNVHLFAADGPESRILEDLGVAIHGQSFSRSNQKENLADGYPPALPGLCNLGLLHTALSGRKGHEPYAPCQVSDLTAKGYDYWALGHVHGREVVREDPGIHFPGNLQGRHIRESGAKGALLVELEPGKRPEVRFLPLDVLRWEMLSLPTPPRSAGLPVLEEGIHAALTGALARAEGRFLVVRAIIPREDFSAPGNAGERWLPRVRALAADVAGERIWVERVVAVETRETGCTMSPGSPLAPPDEAAGSLLDDLCGGLVTDPEVTAHLREELKEKLRALPVEITQGEEGLRLDDEVWLGELLDRARRLIQRELAVPAQTEQTE